MLLTRIEDPEAEPRLVLINGPLIIRGSAKRPEGT
jgi:hypothetical protein